MRARWPGLGAWLIGTPIGVLLGLGLFASLAVARPARFVRLADDFLRPMGHRFQVDDIVLEMPDGPGHPGAWRWRIRGLGFLGKVPDAPVLLLDEATLDVPRIVPTPGGWQVRFPELRVERADLFFAETKRPEDWAITVSPLERVAIDHVRIERFVLTMAAHADKPEVLVDAEAVVGTDVSFQPGPRLLTAQVDLGVATASVAGVAFTDVHADDGVQFTGTGLRTHATGTLGEHQQVEVDLVVDPLFRPPKVTLDGVIRDGTLGDLADAILGPGTVAISGALAVTGHLEAGDAVGVGKLRGYATVHVGNADLTLPDDVKDVIVAALHLAPFLRLDGRTILFGDLDGRVSFTERGVDFDHVVYEAPHSDATIAGYVHSRGLSAKMHFDPRPGEGAVEWGIILRGELDKPKVALAVPAVLRSWEPCHDPLDCPLKGGAPEP